MITQEAAKTYQQALDYLYSFINLEHKRQDRYMASKIDANRMHRIVERLNAPHQAYPTIHIAGTKGKGSVAAMSAFALRAAGLKVGLYTSPHMEEFRERIRILTPHDSDGRIPPQAFISLINHLQTTIIPEFPHITWFELTTALAFLHFAREAVDIAVIEVGLGGRLDTTNVVTPLVSVVTSLSLDHTALLGNTLEQIAYEKGGIIKQGVPVVTAAQPEPALNKLIQIAQQREAPLTLIGKDYTYQSLASTPYHQEIKVRHPATGTQWPLQLNLAGSHQQENSAVTWATLQLVQPHFPNLTTAAIMEGIAATKWPGRLQIVAARSSQTPLLLADSAHNHDSAQKLSHALQEIYHYNRLILIMGASADKDVSKIIQPLLPLAHTIIMSRCEHPRAADPTDLAATVADLGYTAEANPVLTSAVTQAWQLATPDDLICVTGSIFIVGELLVQWPQLQATLIPNHKVI